MVSQGSKEQGYHQGISPRHRLRAFTGIPGFFTVWEAALTTNTNILSDGILDHSGPSRRSNPESGPLLVLDFHHSKELHLRLQLQAVLYHSTDPAG